MDIFYSWTYEPRLHVSIHITKCFLSILHLREFIFIEYIKKVVQVDYPDNGLRARSSLSQDKISADELAPIVTVC